ncbi:hypothetical protein G6F56_005177 [Rhizopus delemar]|nr:hypothetical protein G6F56_005177 [Rhizopus delemar]
MCDMLRSLSHFPHFYKTITDVHLIEASTGLRKLQRAALVNGSQDDDVVRFKGNKEEAAYETITREDGKNESEWREMLVDIDDTDESERNFRLMKSAHPTVITKAYMDDEKFKTYNDGDRVEISPDSWGLIEKVAKYLERNGGTGLAIDYGQDYIQGHTLRAIKNHEIIHPMRDPGTADLSADVDFSFLKQVIKERSDISSYGPITQTNFLQSLGIQARVEKLFRNAKSSESRKAILDGAERLMDPEAMGRIYKVLAFSKDSHNVTTSRPVGFEDIKR